MSWLLCAAGWGVAIVLRGALSVQRSRTAKWKDRAAKAEYDMAFLTEKLAEFIDRTNVAEARLRARDLQRNAAEEYERKRRAN